MKRVLFVLDTVLAFLAIVVVIVLSLVAAAVVRLVGFVAHGLAGDWRKRR